MHAPMEFAEVWIGQAGHFGELAKRQVGELPLAANEGAKRLHLGIPLAGHLAPPGRGAPGYRPSCSVLQADARVMRAAIRGLPRAQAVLVRRCCRSSWRP